MSTKKLVFALLITLLTLFAIPVLIFSWFIAAPISATVYSFIPTIFVSLGLFFGWFFILGAALFIPIFWLVMLIDCIKSKTPFKGLWVLAMFCFGPIASILYILFRKPKKQSE